MNISAEIIWLIAGILLFFAEFAVPGLVIAFFGGGAVLTAIATWIKITTTLHSQLFFFILSSLALLVLLRRTMRRIFLGNQESENQPKDFNLELGKLVPVIKDIIPGRIGGKVRYQGALWEASSEETIRTGQNARIIGCRNITLLVEPARKEE